MFIIIIVVIVVVGDVVIIIIISKAMKTNNIDIVFALDIGNIGRRGVRWAGYVCINNVVDVFQMLQNIYNPKKKKTRTKKKERREGDTTRRINIAAANACSLLVPFRF